MLALVERAFRHLSGSDAGSYVFQLTQEVGGGKTRCMTPLGLMARDLNLCQEVCSQIEGGNPFPSFGACQVVGFNGRSTDATGRIWGLIVEQLFKAEQFTRYLAPLLSPWPAGVEGASRRAAAYHFH